MPSGKTHTKMSAWLAVGLAPVSPTAALGCLSGVLLSPDLDVDAGYYGLHVLRTIWGDFVADVWWAFWLPYAKIMPHRSIASHFPLLSTAVRLVYVLLPMLLITYAVGYMTTGAGAPLAEQLFRFLTSPPFLKFAAGLALSDTVHAVADVVVSAVR